MRRRQTSVAVFFSRKLPIFLYFGTARRGIEEQVAQLARIGLDVDGALGGAR